MSHKHLAILFLVMSQLILQSCQSTVTQSMLNSFAPTATLILNQDLTIPANTAGVFIQGGKVVTAAERDQYHANCRLIVNDLISTSQVVKADQFSIKRMQSYEDYVKATSPRYAATGNVLLLADGSPSPQNFAIVFYLSSSKQPNVTTLACAHWEDPSFAKHLTPEQIRTTLGDIMTLK